MKTFCNLKGILKVLRKWGRWKIRKRKSALELVKPVLCYATNKKKKTTTTTAIKGCLVNGGCYFYFYETGDLPLFEENTSLETKSNFLHAHKGR